MPTDIKQIFKSYAGKGEIFKNKQVLQHNHIPEKLPHREREAEELAKILGPTQRLEIPSNVFIYGKPGTGKTAVTLHVGSILEEMKNPTAPIEFIYLNTSLKKVADTEYRLYSTLANRFGVPAPKTGLPTDKVYDLFLSAIDKKSQMVVLTLDEIDHLIDNSPEVLYTLTRINSELENSSLSLIGITDKIQNLNNLEPRTRSSLSEEEILFSPYNAPQLQDILRARASKAFQDSVIFDGAVETCAAYAAQEHGDARRALDLLRVAGELTERKNKNKVTKKEVKEAMDKIDRDRTIKITKTLPQQSKVVLYSILLLDEERNRIFTGPLYDKYQELAKKSSLRALTSRRISDLINELDTLGLITARVISRGRHGRTRTISPSLSEELKEKVLRMLKMEVG